MAWLIVLTLVPLAFFSAVFVLAVFLPEKDTHE
jgi:predicted membrane-bound mannosyltransferase